MTDKDNVIWISEFRGPEHLRLGADASAGPQSMGKRLDRENAERVERIRSLLDQIETDKNTRAIEANQTAEQRELRDYRDGWKPYDFGIEIPRSELSCLVRGEPPPTSYCWTVKFRRWTVKGHLDWEIGRAFLNTPDLKFHYHAGVDDRSELKPVPFIAYSQYQLGYRDEVIVLATEVDGDSRQFHSQPHEDLLKEYHHSRHAFVHGIKQPDDCPERMVDYMLTHELEPSSPFSWRRAVHYDSLARTNYIFLVRDELRQFGGTASSCTDVNKAWSRINLRIEETGVLGVPEPEPSDTEGNLFR